jgi:hypothetical protein
MAQLVDAAERARWDGNHDVLLDIVAQIKEHLDEETAERADVIDAASDYLAEGAWIEPKRRIRRALIEQEGFDPARVDEVMRRLESGE